MRPFAFSRADSVATRILLSLVFAGTALFALVLPVLAWLRGSALTRVVDTGLAGTVTISSATPRPGVEVTWPGTAQVRLADPSGGLWAWQIAAGAALTLAVGIVAVLLIALLRRIQQDRQFSTSTVLLLRLVAVTIIIGAMAVTLLDAIATAELLGVAFDQDSRSVSLTAVPQVVAFAIAPVIAASAEVIARGERLSEDVKGLV